MAYYQRTTETGTHVTYVCGPSRDQMRTRLTIDKQVPTIPDDLGVLERRVLAWIFRHHRDEGTWPEQGVMAS
ncbi:hypothetical protein KIH74_27910 [Kineosporia sp. J2-2]|uniref:Uncharacterized protein n=1 Tax=Kineosporia corallincola TaxID=2835133 RepID=A0ABS5TNX2_9ACTN|nr:hypothetical protein [Kineosporia corallincola]MBT0772800.1 hypothetical protein [Kineosporia corallincola]